MKALVERIMRLFGYTPAPDLSERVDGLFKATQEKQNKLAQTAEETTRVAERHTGDVEALTTRIRAIKHDKSRVAKAQSQIRVDIDQLLRNHKI